LAAMAPPRVTRKKGKGAGGKTDLRPDRKQFKRHHKEDAAAEQGDGNGERQQSAAPGSAALLAAASDEADFPRGKCRAEQSRNTPPLLPVNFALH
jgi:rRNA biogenesis protein RRP5